MLWILILALVTLSTVLLMCLKIKSSKKDPAFAGLEGTISPLGKRSESIDGAENGAILRNGAATPSPRFQNSLGVNSHQTQHVRTPSRGDRKLPEIPKVEDGNSDLYATLDGDDSDDDQRVVRSEGASNVQLVTKDTHPYAKVKKKNGGVEHPYATVKKLGLNSVEAKTNNQEDSSSSSSDEEDDEDDDQFLLRPGDYNSRGSRPGSNRSSRHNVDGAAGNNGSRQTTPLPPEPPPNVQMQPDPNLQNPNMHFSGDSQDSSKGYTSITVREPVRHIQLQRGQQQQLLQQDATYATVSETSDDMYAAIEDPTYVPTGTSQSNSDTYAIIDLPEESEVDLAPSGAASDRPRVNPNLGSEHHTYSKVNKVKKRAGPQAQVPQEPTRAGVRRSIDALGLEDMYAKVHKHRQGDDSEELPMGASAMNPSASTGARPKVRSSLNWARNEDRLSRAEINYSDYEVAHYDKGDKADNSDKKEAPYETLAEKRDTSDGGYEVLPENKDWKKKRRYNADGGYETVNPTGGGGVSEEGYEVLPDYWRSTNSNGGYETVTESANRNILREPGYEVVRERGYERKVPNNDDEADVGYETITGRKRGNNNSEYDPNYEVLATSNSSSTTTTTKRDSDEPGYETVSDKGLPEYETVKSANNQQDKWVKRNVTRLSSTSSSNSSRLTPAASPVVHMSVVRSPRQPRSGASSVVVIERMDVSDVDEGSGNEGKTHIYV